MQPALRSRGEAWFRALAAGSPLLAGDPASVLAADAPLNGETARFLCVVPNPQARFPCASKGEVGIEEALALAARVREVIQQPNAANSRPIVAIVDVKSQAYGRREETAAIFLAGAAAADAYATARMLGHPVIALIVGQAFSGAFLTHGYLANRILAFDDPGVTIHAMRKEAAARITRRSVTALERLGESIAPMSYNVEAYAKLGLLHRLLRVDNPDVPSSDSTQYVCEQLAAAVHDVRLNPRDLSSRLASPEAAATRKATLAVRQKMAEQWKESR